ncbi:MAG TPA: glycosyltransferase family 4 protein [Acidimicrobiales bacterium]|nr:glycosyltransferase family 4 protein [Acidimicrobiales bacterium]
MPGGSPSRPGSVPVVVATILRERGCTGVHTHVRQFMRYLDAHGVPAHLVTPSSAEPLASAAVSAVRLPFGHLNGSLSVLWYRHWHEVFLRRALRRHLEGLGEAVVYAQGPLEARAALATRAGPHQRVVMAVHFHTSQAEEWADKRYITRRGTVYRDIAMLERTTLPAVDGLVYVSEAAREALLHWLPEAGAVPSAVIPNFVDPPVEVPAPGRLGDLVTVGGLENYKNHRFLLDVLGEAGRLGRSLTLDIYGEGPCRRELEHRARALGIEAQVRLRGFVADARAHLPAYRAYVHASPKETGPLAVIEAMAAGLPVVAGEYGGVPELVRAGVEGRFWPLEDPAKAAAVLLELLDSEEACADASRAARARYAGHYRADILAPRLWSFLMGDAPAVAPAPAPEPETRRPAPVGGATLVLPPLAP